VTVGTAPQRRLAHWLTFIVALALAALVSPTPADALSPDADAGTWGAHGRVLAMVRAGNVLYLGGRFDRLQSPDGKIKVPAQNIAAIDLTTGLPVSTFHASVAFGDSRAPEVDALAMSADGTRLLVGGKFTLVNGQSKPYFAALSPSSGAIDTSFAATPFSASVHAIVVTPTKTYVGGAFKHIGKAQRLHLAALLPGGTLDPAWVPTADDVVRSLELAPDGLTIFVGGLFENVDNTSRQSVARVSTATGALDPWAIPAGVINTPQTAWHMLIRGSVIYIGFGHGPNYLAAFRLDLGPLGLQLWRVNTVGNVESLAMAPDGSRLFFGGHFGTGALQQRVCNGPFLHGLASVAPATGAILCDWIPQITPFGSNYVGVWTIVNVDNTIWIGGKIEAIDGVTHLGMARYTLGPSPA
jgi:hypothetical protein